MKNRFLAATVAAILLSAGTVASASASTQAPNSELDTAHAIGFLQHYGVSATVREGIVEGLKEGRLPLSDVPGSRPVSARVQQSGAFVETVSTFADGSITVASVQVLPGEVVDPSAAVLQVALPSTKGASASSASITGCSVTSGSGYSTRTGCLVKGSGALVDNWFYATYTYVQGANNDYISKTYNAGASCGWSCSIPSKSNEQLKETAYLNAGVTYRGTWSSPVSTATTYLTLNVGDNTSSASFSVI
jgi:hypothetical protein